MKYENSHPFDNKIIFACKTLTYKQIQRVMFAIECLNQQSRLFMSQAWREHWTRTFSSIADHFALLQDVCGKKFNYNEFKMMNATNLIKCCRYDRKELLLAMILLAAKNYSAADLINYCNKTIGDKENEDNRRNSEK